MHPPGRKLIAFALGVAAVGGGACKKETPPPPAQEEASVPAPVPATPEFSVRASTSARASERTSGLRCR